MCVLSLDAKLRQCGNVCLTVLGTATARLARQLARRGVGRSVSVSGEAEDGAVSKGAAGQSPYWYLPVG